MRRKGCFQPVHQVLRKPLMSSDSQNSFFSRREVAGSRGGPGPSAMYGRKKKVATRPPKGRLDFDSKWNRWRAEVTYYPKAKTGIPKKVRSSWTNSEKEANKAMDALVKECADKGAVNPTYSKPSSVERKAYQRVKSQLGWTKLTILDWQTHPDLKDIKTLEGIPRRVLLRLDLEFGGCYNSKDDVVSKAELDRYRYLADSSEKLAQRAEEATKNAKSLRKKLTEGSLASLLITYNHPGNEEEEELQEVNFKRKKPEEVSSIPIATEVEESPPSSSDVKHSSAALVLSEAQLRRLTTQAALVSDFLFAQAAHDDEAASSRTAEALRLRESLIRKASGSVCRISSDAAPPSVASSTTSSSKTYIGDIAAFVIERNESVLSTVTLREWTNEYLRLGGFLEDRRGHWQRESLIALFPDMQNAIKVFVRDNRFVTVEIMRRYISDHIRSSLNEDDEASRSATMKLLSARSIDVQKGVSAWTAHTWMQKAGCKFHNAKHCYYTDNHNRGDVREYRDEYITERELLSLRQPVWFRDSTGVDRHIDEMREDIYDAWTTQEHGVNGMLRSDFALHAEAAREDCKHKHAPDVCRCDKVLYHIGQDESIYKSSSFPKKEWQVDGAHKRHKKGDGSGVMVSALVDEERGFGFPLSPEETAMINEHRLRAGKDTLGVSSTYPTGSPGLIFFKHGTGSGREGYWNCDCLLQQLTLLMDCFEVLHSDRQLLIEIDWSSGHTKMPGDGLIATKMNASWGGKQPKMRETIVTAECLGDGTGRCLEPGSVQSLIFCEGDGPPHFDPAAPKYDTTWDATSGTAMRKGKKKSKKKRTKSSAVGFRDLHRTTDTCADVGAEEEEGCSSSVAPFHTEQEGVGDDFDGAIIDPGYVGQAKGLRQILWERGLYVERMLLDDMRKVLAACPDFSEEMGIIQKAVHDRGHILILSPKCHPEVAGLGIEYCWGKSKLTFRRHTNDFTPQNLHDNVLRSMDSVYVPLSRVRRYARRTRTYLKIYAEMKQIRDEAPNGSDMSEQDVARLLLSRCYQRLEREEAASGDGGGGEENAKNKRRKVEDSLLLDGYVAIEKMVKVYKSHRNIVDIEVSYLNKK